MTQLIAYGAGTAPAELQVEAALLAGGFARPSVRYRRLAAGITNLNWLVHDGETTLFLKLFGAGTEGFINRDASSAASRLAGELGVGPRLLAYLPDPGAEIYVFLDGYRGFTSQDMVCAKTRSALLAAYRQMHGAPPLPETLTGLDQLADRLTLAHKISAPLPRDIDQLGWQCQRVRTAIADTPIRLSPSHNDSYAANFMINDHGEVRIIDWEYASNNDPAWDVSMIAMAQYDDDGIAALTTAYLGVADPAFEARVRLYGAVMCISWGVWAALQSRLSTLPFDFLAYSQLLFAMGRQKLTDERWERALWQV